VGTGLGTNAALGLEVPVGMRKFVTTGTGEIRETSAQERVARMEEKAACSQQKAAQAYTFMASAPFFHPWNVPKDFSFRPPYLGDQGYLLASILELAMGTLTASAWEVCVLDHDWDAVAGMATAELNVERDGMWKAEKGYVQTYVDSIRTFLRKFCCDDEAGAPTTVTVLAGSKGVYQLVEALRKEWVDVVSAGQVKKRKLNVVLLNGGEPVTPTGEESDDLQLLTASRSLLGNGLVERLVLTSHRDSRGRLVNTAPWLALQERAELRKRARSCSSGADRSSSGGQPPLTVEQEVLFYSLNDHRLIADRESHSALFSLRQGWGVSSRQDTSPLVDEKTGKYLGTTNQGQGCLAADEKNTVQRNTSSNLAVLVCWTAQPNGCVPVRLRALREEALFVEQRLEWGKFVSSVQPFSLESKQVALVGSDVWLDTLQSHLLAPPEEDGSMMASTKGDATIVDPVLAPRKDNTDTELHDVYFSLSSLWLVLRPVAGGAEVPVSALLEKDPKATRLVRLFRQLKLMISNWEKLRRHRVFFLDEVLLFNKNLQNFLALQEGSFKGEGPRDVLEFAVEFPLALLGRSPYLGYARGEINTEHASLGSSAAFGPVLEDCCIKLVDGQQPNDKMMPDPREGLPMPNPSLGVRWWRFDQEFLPGGIQSYVEAAMRSVEELQVAEEGQPGEVNLRSELSKRLLGRPAEGYISSVPAHCGPSFKVFPSGAMYASFGVTDWERKEIHSIIRERRFPPGFLSRGSGEEVELSTADDEEQLQVSSLERDLFHSVVTSSHSSCQWHDVTAWLGLSPNVQGRLFRRNGFRVRGVRRISRQKLQALGVATEQSKRLIELSNGYHQDGPYSSINPRYGFLYQKLTEIIVGRLPSKIGSSTWLKRGSFSLERDFPLAMLSLLILLYLRDVSAAFESTDPMQGLTWPSKLSEQHEKLFRSDVDVMFLKRRGGAHPTQQVARDIWNKLVTPQTLEAFVGVSPTPVFEVANYEARGCSQDKRKREAIGGRPGELWAPFSAALKRWISWRPESPNIEKGNHPLISPLKRTLSQLLGLDVARDHNFDDHIDAWIKQIPVDLLADAEGLTAELQRKTNEMCMS